MAKKNNMLGYLAIGGAALGAYFLFGSDDAKAKKSKKKKEDPTEPPPPAEVDDDDTTDPTPPPPPPQEKIDAPEYPHDSVSLYQAEQATANAEHGLWLGYLNEAAEELGRDNITDTAVQRRAAELYGAGNRSVLTKMTDKVFYETHPELDRQIPKKSKRGSGWAPYINDWKRINEYIRTLRPKVPTKKL